MALSKLANLFLGRAQAFRRVFGGRDGKRVLGLILREGQVDRDPTVPGDPLSTGVNIGRQNLCRYIINQMGMPEAEIVRRANALIDEEAENAIQNQTDLG